MTQMRNFAEAREMLLEYANRTALPGHYSLEKMQKLMGSLGNPQNKLKVIHVAGTSGKTSTCYYIAALLQAAGQKVGLTVSPHVDEVNERVQINLTPMPEAEFCQKLGEFIDLVEQTGVKPSYFELLIAFAYWYFASEKVDYAVVEVGMGGLLDGTNVISREDKVCVITDIGLDHTKVLGNTIAKIAAQKAGIIQPHNPIFVYRQINEVMKPIQERCRQMHSLLHEIDPNVVEQQPSYLPPFQQRNYQLARTVFDFVTDRDKLTKLSKPQLVNTSHTVVPARLEVVKFKGKTLIIDGSHNSQKMAAAVEGVQKLYANQKVAALVGFVESERERAEGALQQLHKLTNSIIVTAFSGQQDTPKYSVDPKIIASTARRLGFEHIVIVNDPAEAFSELIKRPEQVLLVTGSFYLLNHIRPLIK